MIRQEVRQRIGQAVRRKYGQTVLPDFTVEVPENLEHGDYATNVALILAKQLKKPPMEIARDLAAALTTYNSKPAIKIGVAPPGFINFWLSPESLPKELGVILSKKEKYGAGPKKKEKISVEYLDANPTGPIHIGHARSGFLGDALSNILEFYGHPVTREFYVNNAKVSGQIKSLGSTALGKGQEYRHAGLVKILKNKKVRRHLKKIKDEGEAGFFVAKIIQKENEEFLKEKTGIKFDLFFEEESVYQSGAVKKLVEVFKKKGLLYEKDGAWWFRAAKFGDNEDRVFIRKTGEPTYVLPDISYHLDKFLKRKIQKAVNIFGADHHGYGPRLRAALSALGIDTGRLHIITVQTARLTRSGKEFKMSKRRGVFVTLEDLIKEVGLDAARWFFLEKSPDTHMDFDLDLAKERSVKNPVYYAQYAHARIASIFRQAKKTYDLQPTTHNLLRESEELGLIKHLIRFPEVVEDTACDYQIHRLTRYAHDLARDFHNFYEKHRVITGDNDLTAARLQLVGAAQIVLQSTFSLLGISAPDKM